MHSIRSKITAITIAAILTSVLSVLGAGYFTIKAENDRSSTQIMNLVSTKVQQSMDDYLNSIEQSVELLSSLASDNLDAVALVEGGVAGKAAETAAQSPEQAAQLDARLAEYCDRLLDVFGSVAAQTSGVMAYYYCLSPEVSRTQHGFYYCHVGKSGFVAQPPLDAGQLDPEEDGSDIWYTATVRRGRPSWIGPYTSRYQGDTLTCSYAVPIYKAGVLVGVMGMDIPFETLTEQVSAIRVYGSGYACLLDEDARVLYHPEIAYGEPMDRLDQATADRVFQQRTNGDALLLYQVDGQRRQMSFSTLSNGMKLAIVAPRSEILSPWIQLTRAILLITVVIVAVFSMILLLMVRIIIRPLQRLTAASKRLANEDYDVELSYGGKDEVGTLTQAFMQMRNHVKLYVDDLNRRIYTDPMTNLPNMRHFFKLAQSARDRMVGEGKHTALLYFNLIGMKFYNRQHGFEEGDKLICDIAAVLVCHYGRQYVSHFNQDHFAAVTDEEGLEDTLRQVLAECENANGGKSLPVLVGIYQDSLGEVDVNAACDRAKYASDRLKGAYASGWRYFDREMLDGMLNNNYIIHHLDQALAEGWIKVYYQPIIRAANGRVCDEEALARWIDPEKGFLSPGQFIPVLEDAKLIYKLDLYMAEQILEKMKRQAEAGLYVVPQSVNLSRVDFEVCDIVEEIRRRVDDAGIDRDKLTIEITESVIGSNFAMMKAQVERFQALGFQVWMDDFGSGYSSLDVLQSIHFDLIKLDMRFMQQFDNSDKSRIILTELIKMAIGLGIDTVCEGVERQDQVDFLREVGCSKLQGFYFCKPIPPEEIVERNRKGIQIGYENPNESDYYASIGRVNLYDLSTVSAADDNSYDHYFDTLPMAILESGTTQTRITRCNRSYRDFMERTFGILQIGTAIPYDDSDDGPGAAFKHAMQQCGPEKPLVFMNEELAGGATVHALIRHIAVNPVTGITACAVAVLGISDESDRGVTYTHIAQALSADYINLYYVNMETDQFSEYAPDPANAGLAVERRGENFFNQSRDDALRVIFEGDREAFLAAFTKQNVADAIDRDGAFTLTYRLLVEGKPKYVNMKAVRMSASDKHIIIGVNNVDAQMKQREALDRMREEQTTYARITALTGDFIAIYTVDPVTDHYVQYSASQSYEGLQLSREGEDFFAASQADSARTIFEEDLPLLRASFTKENVLRTIQESGLYTLQYRLMIEGVPQYVILRAALVEEKDGAHLIIGVDNIDAQVRREQEYEHSLSLARNTANLDALTGVKNRAAYADQEARLNAQIAQGQPLEFAVTVFEVPGLRDIQAAQGQAASEVWLKRACSVICTTFKHSPVFRIGEASFIALSKGHDFQNIDALTTRIADISRENAAAGDVIIACGAARFEGDQNVASILRRAEANISRPAQPES